jgi:cytochrome P450
MTTGQSLGERYDPLGVHAQDPYEFYALARQQQPVFFHPALGAWVVTRYDDVRAVLRDAETFSSTNSLRPVAQPDPRVFAEFAKGYPMAPEAVNTDGATHRRLRSPFASGLAADEIRTVERHIRQRTAELLDAFAGDGRAELIGQFADPLPLAVIGHLFGLDPADMPTVHAGSHGMLMLGSAHGSGEEQVAAARQIVALQQLLAGYIRRRRAEPGEDLISRMLGELAPAEGQLTFDQEAELVESLFGTLLAGHTTTSDLLGNGIWHLLTHREQWELLCARAELIPGAVEEIARYDTSVQAQFRVTTRPVTLAGQALPEGAEVLVLFGSANRDEALVERAEAFDITRPPSRHLTFGFGVHFCAGAHLARAEMRIALQALTERLPGLRLADGRQVTIAPSLRLRGPRALHVVW